MQIKVLSLYAITSIVLIEIANTTSFTISYLLAAICVLMTMYYVITLKEINFRVILLFGVWIVINVASSSYFGLSLKLGLTLRYALNLVLLTWFIVDIYGNKFLEVLEKIIYYLTFISLPLYALNFLFKSEFDQLSSIFEGITNPNLLANVNYWSGIVYVNAISQQYGSLELLRNTGFMWEPGYFALIIVFALGYRWLNYGIKFDKHFYVYFTAILTTFSTAGYFALLVLISAYFLKKSSIKNVLLVFGISIIFFIYVYQLDFMRGKIDIYLTAIAANDFNYDVNYQSVKLNRIQIAIYDVYRVIRYPFGFGLNDRVSFDNIDVVGTNGLSGLLRMWGVVVFFYFMKLIYNYHNQQNKANLGWNSKMLIYLSLLLVFFSQSIQYNILTYLIISSAIYNNSQSRFWSWRKN